MPFPTTRTIPHGWGQHVAGAAAGAMNGTCTVRDPNAAGGTVWNPDTEQREPVPAAVLYTGPCRVQEFMRASDTVQTDQDTTSRRYRVQLDLAYVAGPFAPGHHVTITAAENDTDLVTATTATPLIVEDVLWGTERATRDLICAANLG